MESVWKQCEAHLAHPGINPLRAILYMIYITYVPHILRIPLVFKAQVGVMVIACHTDSYAGQQDDHWLIHLSIPFNG